MEIFMSKRAADGPTLRIGTALWMENGQARQVMVAPLPSDPSRVVDLHRVEIARLSRLGEGRPRTMAEVLVPATLQGVLEAGPRGFHRVHRALAYAEKWHQRGDLPDFLAPPLMAVTMLACLPEPRVLRRADGGALGHLPVQGPGAVVGCPPQPTLAAVGWQGDGLAGFCLAVEDLRSVVLGAWLQPDFSFRGALELRTGRYRRTLPMDAWEGLEIPHLDAGEIQLLPPARYKAMSDVAPGMIFSLKAPFETLELSLGEELVHPTLQ